MDEVAAQMAVAATENVTFMAIQSSERGGPGENFLSCYKRFRMSTEFVKKESYLMMMYVVAAARVYNSNLNEKDH